MKSIRLKKTPIVRYHARAKANNLKIKPVLRCSKCLELTTLRVFQADGVNRIACVLCLNSARYDKSKTLSEQNITINRTLTLKEVCKRYILRLKVYFTGNHIYGPFGRKRRK